MAHGQNVSGQNVSATKHFGTKCIDYDKFGHKTDRLYEDPLQNVPYRLQNVWATKHIGGQKEPGVIHFKQFLT
jgi:hypothetical protein